MHIFISLLLFIGGNWVAGPVGFPQLGFLLIVPVWYSSAQTSALPIPYKLSQFSSLIRCRLVSFSFFFLARIHVWSYVLPLGDAHLPGFLLGCQLATDPVPRLFIHLGLYNAMFFFFFNYLFIFGCVGSSLLHAGFSLAAACGGYSSFIAVRGLLITVASLVAEHGL